MDRVQVFISSMLLLVVVLALVGCGKRTLTKPTVYPTRGLLLVKGKPAANMRLILLPKSETGFTAGATTDEYGNFDLRTFDNFEADGAVPGIYEVTLNEMKTGIEVEILPEVADDLQIKVP